MRSTGRLLPGRLDTAKDAYRNQEISSACNLTAMDSGECGTESVCDDGFDNDCDGLYDCSDTDCSCTSVFVHNDSGGCGADQQYVMGYRDGHTTFEYDYDYSVCVSHEVDTSCDNSVPILSVAITETDAQTGLPYLSNMHVANGSYVAVPYSPDLCLPFACEAVYDPVGSDLSGDVVCRNLDVDTSCLITVMNEYDPQGLGFVNAEVKPCDARNRFDIMICCKEVHENDTADGCFDGIDNDGDGFVDCGDADCNEMPDVNPLAGFPDVVDTPKFCANLSLGEQYYDDSTNYSRYSVHNSSYEPTPSNIQTFYCSFGEASDNDPNDAIEEDVPNERHEGVCCPSRWYYDSNVGRCVETELCGSPTQCGRDYLADASYFDRALCYEYPYEDEKYRKACCPISGWRYGQATATDYMDKQVFDGSDVRP